MSAAGWDGDKVPCLCNDCLRVVPLTWDQVQEQQDDNGIISCVCGGENGPCWCGSCQKTARLLLEGERRSSVLDVYNCGDVIKWSVAGGVRK